MALTIKQQGDTFFLEGTLSATTIKNFKTHFDFAQNSFNNLTINLDGLSSIDASAMQTLKAMYKNAIYNYAIFFVKGNRSEEIYESFRFLNNA